jgi:hypothetical protein
MIPRPAPALPAPLPPVSLPRLLLVEGDTPLHFFEAFLTHLALNTGIEIRNFRSVTNLRAFLIDLAATAEFQTLVTSVGIVRDAEADAAAARQSVEGALTAAGLTATKVPPITTSIFILPDNASPGMIETLCMQATEAEAAHRGACTCVAEFFTCLGRSGASLPAEPKLAKNRAQAYLATRMDVQLFPGQAAYRGHWPWDNPVFDRLRLFLQAL